MMLKGMLPFVRGDYDLSSNLYDVSLQFDNFRVLNTKVNQNDAFYLVSCTLPGKLG